jgi:hypothetical protein
VKSKTEATYFLDETRTNGRRGGPDKLCVKVPDSSYLNKNLLEVSQKVKISPEEAVLKL